LVNLRATWKKAIDITNESKKANLIDDTLTSSNSGTYKDAYVQSQDDSASDYAYDDDEEDDDEDDEEDE
jgi:hypothetical protein